MVSLPHACKNCKIKCFCFYKGIGSPIAKTDSLFNKGDVICREGENFKGLFSIKTGVVKAYRHGHYGTDRIKDFYYPKDLLGLDGLHNNKYQETLIAVNSVSICMLRSSDLNKAINSNITLQKNMLNIASEKISDLYDRPDVKVDVEQKLCLFFIKLMNKTGIALENNQYVELPMLREEIANYLGTANETISRCLNGLKKKEVVTTTKNGIKVLSINKLQMLAHGRSLSNTMNIHEHELHH